MKNSNVKAATAKSSKSMRKKCVMIAAGMILYLSTQAQQIVLSGGETRSQSGVTCTVSVGEALACQYASGALSLSSGIMRPAPETGPSANASVETEFVRMYYDASSQKIFIKTSANAGNLKCAFYTMTGTLFLQTVLPEEPESSISLDGLAKGVYLLKINTRDYSKTYKFIKN
jgi:hypothetical protein